LSKQRRNVRKQVKRKTASDMPRVQLDVALLIDKIQQQLASLDRKIDALISQSSQRPPEQRQFSQPFQRFDRPDRHGPRDRDNNFRERSFTRAICAECKKECEVPFKPSGDRPVYCKECFAKRKSNSSPFPGKFDRSNREGEFIPKKRHFDKRQNGQNRGPDERKKPSFRRRK
jgi:CxxC-x17-CxxC domain-containing protein